MLQPRSQRSGDLGHNKKEWSPERTTCSKQGAMAQSLADIILHCIFSTKERTPWIQPDVEEELYQYISGVCRNLNSPVIKINGVEDHIHVLLQLGKTIPQQTHIRNEVKFLNRLKPKEIIIKISLSKQVMEDFLSLDQI